MPLIYQDSIVQLAVQGLTFYLLAFNDFSVVAEVRRQH